MPPSPSTASGLVASLIAAVGPDIIIWGEDIPDRYRHDWSGCAPVDPIAVARPRTTQEVAAILRHCHAAHLPVVPQGGLTGLAGGAQPTADGIVLSLDRMQGVEEIDTAMGTMTVLAGTPLAVAQAAADDAGFMLALDLGARGSCAIGGNLSTNAGGNRVIRYGMARDHVLGVEAVLPDGTVLASLNKLLKNNAGYDLKQLFIGSEGTLGVITRAVLRLQPKPSYVASALCALSGFDNVIELLKQSRSRIGPGLSSFEVMWPSFYDFMADNLGGVKRPFKERHGAYVLIEINGFDPTRDADHVQEVLGELIESGVLSDAVLSSSERESRELWAVREGVSEYGRLFSGITAFDVGLSLQKTGAFVERMEAQLKKDWPGAITLSYGHVGDNNLHLVAHVPSAGAHQPHDEIAGFVYGAVRDAGGTVSAEHGIGLTKKPYLGFSRTAEEIELMRRLKQAIDPRNILNPGKVFTMAPSGDASA